ncbi:hypothetical protein O181_044032 [Austropuccinia psidii MF-1]|uniref:Integrase catalytic domain-containing protein n=1 Tax=Austropuccinia psidii MF-1 TaxID=1389203 RepID=A0A9Q3DR07_9BASI|nr:hypothetical protein [Austropuccinia psidii MF-1]
MDTAIMMWNRVISDTDLFQNIISDRNPKFISEFWTNFHNFFGTKLSFSTAYYPQTDGLAERMAQNSEEMIKIFCTYGLDLKDSEGITHNWCTSISALELECKKSIHYSTGKTSEMLEKGWKPRIPYDTLRNNLLDIHSKASSFKIMLHKARNYENRCMKNSFKNTKKRWDKSHKPPDCNKGELVLVSTLSFNNIKGSKKLKYFLAGPFMI